MGRRFTGGPEASQQRDREKSARRREAILVLFGGKCVKCGYDADPRALQVDHINRSLIVRNACGRSGQSLYRRILDGTFPKEDFQLLCANCNWLKKLDNEEHFPVATSIEKAPPVSTTHKVEDN
jgi:hypothetical protein